MTSLHVDGEDEQTAEIQIAAKRQVLRLNQGRHAPEWLIALVHWVARESFRAGYAHAHTRNTVRAKPHVYADEEADAEVTLIYDDDDQT